MQAKTCRALLICLLLGLTTLAVFWPVRQHEFLNWDDLTYVTINDHVRGGVSWGNVAWAFTHTYSSNWHPLTWISHMLDCQWFGLSPGPPHLVNLGFHVVNALLLLGFLRRVTGAVWRSAVVAGLFALHPLHVESVAWLAERKDVLSTFFFLLTLLAYAAYVERTTRHSPLAARHLPLATALWYALALVCFALGLMSKPMLVTLPFVLLLLDYWPLARFQLQEGTLTPGNLARLVLEKAPFFALALVSSVVTFLAQKKGGAVAAFAMLPFGARLENALVAYGAYLVKFLWPVDLSPIYPHPAHWETWRVIGAALLLVAATAGAWLGRRRFPFLPVGWLWYLGTLVPVIGLVQVGSQAFADRYTYVPLIGIIVALVWLGVEAISGLRNRGPSEKGITAPGARRGLMGGVLAIAILSALAWRTAQQVPIWKNTGTLFRHALALTPNNVQALYGLGTYLVENGQLDSGQQLLEEAIRLQPQYPEALGSMADLLDGQGKYADAIRFYQAALQAQPNQAEALNNLAWLRASCPDAAFRDGPEAVRLAAKACQLTDYSKPLFIGTLAAAQAEAGDFAAAITNAERAVALATALRLEETAAKNRGLIDLYRQGQTASGSVPKPR
jgi:Tfp pilus assembly protein PilF